jgi:hypothetical protein
MIDKETRLYNIDTKGQFQIFSSIAAISVALADLKIDKRAVKKGRHDTQPNDTGHRMIP